MPSWWVVGAMSQAQRNLVAVKINVELITQRLGKAALTSDL